jgi:predicted esterase
VKYSFLAYLVIIIFYVLSCNSSNTQARGDYNNDKRMETGKVITHIACLKDTSISYSIYLPTDYSTEKEFPLILAFDPHASGNLPVDKYDSLAENYGYILIGSNNSKNGLPMNETEKIVNSLLSEIRTRYSVDSSRIYLMGFSGGARIASLVALYGGGIKGVIGCGAGFPGTSQPGRFRFDYIGFAGNADFNMNELVSLDEQLEEANFRHALVIFDGKHEWPPVETMEYAFIWNEFCAMKDGKEAIMKSRIADFLALINPSIRQDKDQINIYKKKLALEQMIRFLKGLEPVEQEQQELAKLLSSEAYKKEENKINAIREEERKEQQMFTDNFFNNDLTWWNNRISNIEHRISNGTDREEVLMCKRIMSYLSLLAYMNYTHALSSGDKTKEDLAMEVYRIVDPENAAKIK